jgi:hypothetical protein
VELETFNAKYKLGMIATTPPNKEEMKLWPVPHKKNPDATTATIRICIARILLTAAIVLAPTI